MSKRRCPKKASHDGKRLRQASLYSWLLKAPAPTNPFNDLDNATINHLLSFIDAPDAIRLAKCNRRLFNIHRLSRNLRLSRRFDVVLVRFSGKQNACLKLGLGDSTVNRPKKPLFVKFTEDTIEQPDFDFIDEVSLQVKFEEDFEEDHSYERLSNFLFEIPFYDQPTLKCRVRGGDERLGMLALFKFLQKCLVLDQLFIEELDGEMLDFLARNPLPFVRCLHVRPTWGCDKAYEVPRLIKAMPQLDRFVLDLSSYASLSEFSPIFDDPAIRELQTVAIFGDGEREVDVTQMKWRNFISTSFEAPTVTIEEIKQIVEEWKDEKREIEFWDFIVNVDPLTVEEVAELIGAIGEMTNDENWENWKGVVKSKMGKVLKVRIRDTSDGDQVAIELWTLVDWKKSWLNFIMAKDKSIVRMGNCKASFVDTCRLLWEELEVCWIFTT